MEYMGAQARIDVHFGRARFPLFIDLGFGDVFVVQNKNIILTANSKGPLYEASLALQCYPLEFVFAEKLETVIHRGADNSRMKDFQDLISMVCALNALSSTETEAAIKAVFTHRQTKLLLPVRFDVSQLTKLQLYWEQYRHGLSEPEDLPDRVEHVIEIINEWLARETCFK